MSQYTTPGFYTIRNKIVSETLDKYPDAGNHSIARILYRDYPEYFKSMEDARYVVRYRRGKTGSHHLKYLKDKKYVKVQST